MNPALIAQIIKRVLPIVVAVIMIVVTLIVALVLSVAGTTAAANAQTCTTDLQAAPSTAPTAGAQSAAVIVPIRPQGTQTLPHWSADQVRNAATITNTARTMGLPPRAAVIAVAVAMQESSLTNRHDGDRDSQGLFQQRPSQDWGTVSQVTDPVYASESFYRALTKVANWQTIPLTQAAQDVQKSGYPLAYQPWEQAAGALVSQTWGTTAVTSTFAGCTATNDPAADFHSSHPNPRTAAQAIAGARFAGAGNWIESRTGYCANFVGQAYGWGSNGSNSAADQWARLVALGEAHPGDNNPPPGALLFYKDNNPFGHVDLYLGNDQVASTDITGPRKIGIVTREAVIKWLGPNSYLGWGVPDFPSAAGVSTIPLTGGA